MEQEVPPKTCENGPLDDHAALLMPQILHILSRDTTTLEYKKVSIPLDGLDRFILISLPFQGLNMYTSFVFSIGLLLAQALLIHANPLPELIRKFKQRSSDWFMSGSDCRPQQEYNISHQFAIEEPPALVAGVVCNATYSG